MVLKVCLCVVIFYSWAKSGAWKSRRWFCKRVMLYNYMCVMGIG